MYTNAMPVAIPTSPQKKNQYQVAPSIWLVVKARPITERTEVTQYPPLRANMGSLSSFAKEGTESSPTTVARMPKERNTKGKKIQAAALGSPSICILR